MSKSLQLAPSSPKIAPDAPTEFPKARLVHAFGFAEPDEDDPDEVAAARAVDDLAVADPGAEVATGEGVGEPAPHASIQPREALW